MPITNGVFANVSGATNAMAGDVIQSSVWNNIHADYSTALNTIIETEVAKSTNRNLLWMNGGLEVFQRGNGEFFFVFYTASTVNYTADRWYLATGVNQAHFVRAITPGLSDESQLCGQVQRFVGETGTGVLRFGYPLDKDEVYRARGNLVNLSFRARGGANWSPASGTLSFAVYAGTASPTKRNATPYTSETIVLTGTVNLTPGGSIVAVSQQSSVVVPTNTEQLEVQFFWTPVGTAGADDWFQLDDVQLEPLVSTNSLVSSYDRIPLSEMIAGCLRHYQKSFDYNTGSIAGDGVLCALSAITQGLTFTSFFVAFPVQLRTTPSTPTLINPFVTATNAAIYNVSTGSVQNAVVFASVVGSKGFMFRTSVTDAVGNIIMTHYTVSAGI